MLSYLGIIPARYASTRFPGKPLADIHGKTMIRCVYERVMKSINYIVVATDDERIEREIKNFEGNVVMTSAEHLSGTDRCAEALAIFEKQNRVKPDVVINIQGDEPFIQPDQIEILKSCFNDHSTEIATLIKPISEAYTVWDSNRAKVVIDNNGFAIYFSRAAIPYVRNYNKEEWHLHFTLYQHIGLYAYRNETLKKIALLKESNIEKAEMLEQLRWIENGYRIKTAVTHHESYCIDTPEDLERALKMGI